MKSQRNRILRSMRQTIKALNMNEIESKVAAVDKLKDTAKQFEAIRFVRELESGR